MWEVQYKRTSGEWVRHGDLTFDEYIRAKRHALNLMRLSKVIVQIVDTPDSEYESNPQKVDWKKEGF